MLRLALLCSLCFLAVRAQPVTAAAPNVIIVQGDLLAAPIVLDDWDENLDLMLALGEPQPEAPSKLDGRRKLDVSLFWAVGDYLEDGVEPLELLDTEFTYPENHETATLYLGAGPEQPILDYHGYRVVDGSAEDILAAHGVPLVAPEEPGASAVVYGAIASGVVVAAGAVALYARRRGVLTGT
jgi:hypothetical protein